MEIRSEQAYLSHILGSIEKIERYVGEYTQAEFVSDELRISAVIREFEVIGEAARQMPETYRIAHPEVEWLLMIGMRNNLIHHYFGVNEDLVWKTYTEDLPALKEKILALLKIAQAD